MATLVIWSNYEIVNGVKVFGEYKEIEARKIVNNEPISDMDAGKAELWDAFEKFRNDFNFPMQCGETFALSYSELDLRHDEHEYFGCVEGFEYDDSVTQWDAILYENYEF
jgi:hypothetical protein